MRLGDTTGSKPVYVHDCKRCVYLGTTLVPPNKSGKEGYTPADWYGCNNHDNAIIITRHSSEPSDNRTIDARDIGPAYDSFSMLRAGFAALYAELRAS